MYYFIYKLKKLLASELDEEQSKYKLIDLVIIWLFYFDRLASYWLKIEF